MIGADASVVVGEMGFLESYDRGNASCNTLSAGVQEKSPSTPAGLEGDIE